MYKVCLSSYTHLTILKNIIQKHFYQPIWTLVGAGAKTLKSSMKDTAEVIPQNSTWIQNRVASFEPENNTLKLENNDEVSLSL